MLVNTVEKPLEACRDFVCHHGIVRRNRSVEQIQHATEIAMAERVVVSERTCSHILLVGPEPGANLGSR